MFEAVAIVALKGAGWVLVSFDEKPLASRECSSPGGPRRSRYLVYAFAHSATGRVLRVEIQYTDGRSNNQTYDAKDYETKAYDMAFEMLLGA